MLTYLWHFGFHSLSELPETLISGNEVPYPSYFYETFVYDPSAISAEDREVYVEAYSEADNLRGGLEYYRAFATDVEQNQVYAENKLELPVLALYGEASPLTFMVEMMDTVATDVRGGGVPQSGPGCLRNSRTISPASCSTSSPASSRTLPRNQNRIDFDHEPETFSRQGPVLVILTAKKFIEIESLPLVWRIWRTSLPKTSARSWRRSMAVLRYSG